MGIPQLFCILYPRTSAVTKPPTMLVPVVPPSWPRARWQPINAGGCDGLPPHRGCRLRTQLRFQGRRPGTPRPCMGSRSLGNTQPGSPIPRGPSPQPLSWWRGGPALDSLFKARGSPGRTNANRSGWHLTPARARTPSDTAFQAGLLLFSPLCDAIKHDAWGLSAPLFICT